MSGGGAREKEGGRLEEGNMCKEERKIVKLARRKKYRRGRGGEGEGGKMLDRECKYRIGRKKRVERHTGMDGSWKSEQMRTKGKKYMDRRKDLEGKKRDKTV